MNLLDGWFKFDVGEGAFYSVFGLAFVIVGIALLVGVFTLLGFVMKKFNERKGKGKAEPVSVPKSQQPAVEEGVSPEVVAAITAAITAYYEKENVPCDFVVRRIGKL